MSEVWTIDQYRQHFKTPEKKKNKFNAKKVIVDGYKFDSIGESKRYGILKIRERIGEIQNLQLQVVFKLPVEGQPLRKYKADFVYFEKGIRIVEDYKSEPTRKLQGYQMKKRLMKLIHGIDIKETGS